MDNQLVLTIIFCCIFTVQPDNATVNDTVPPSVATTPGTTPGEYSYMFGNYLLFT